MLDDPGIGNIIAGPMEHATTLAERAAKAEEQIRHAEWEREYFTTFEYADRKYIVDRNTKTMKETKAPKKDLLQFPKVGSLRAVAEFANLHGDPGKGAIVVGRDGINAYLGVKADEDEQRPIVNCPYFTGDDAPQGDIGVEALFSWLDRYRDNMGQAKIDAAEENAIWAGVKTIKAKQSEEFTVEDHGAHIEVTFTSKAGINPGSTPIPKYILVHQRVGNREFLADKLYRLRAQLPDKKNGREGLSFQLIHIDTDGAHEKFVKWAVDGLKGLVNEGWIVCEGP